MKNKKASVIIGINALAIYGILTFIPVGYIEGQNITDPSTGEVTPIPLVCGPDIINNNNITSSNTINFSSSDAVTDIRCHLREARQSIAADAADSAVLQINEAEETLLGLFGNNSNNT